VRRLILISCLTAATSVATVAGVASAAGPASAETPNTTGAVVFPADISTPPAVPQVRSYAELEALWRTAGTRYGIPWEVLGAINVIESNLGRNMGPSSAGAVGWMQFMPSTWERWGTDADGDGLADPWDPEDAITSSARYLAAAGGREDLRRGIFAYNHADWYVNDVLELATELAGGTMPAIAAPGTVTSDGPVFVVDGLLERIESDEQEAARHKRAAAALEGRLDDLRQRRVAAVELAGDADVADDVWRRREAAAVRIETAEAGVRAAFDLHRSAHLDALGRLDGRRGAAAVGAFAGVTGGGPLATQAPVIGTPGVGTHSASDWQSGNAVDLAAPPGTPVYAVESGVITQVGGQDPSLGTRAVGVKRIYGYGVTLDGATDNFFYAHLDGVGVTAGQAVVAGQQIGVVAAWSSGPSHVHFATEFGDPAARVGAPSPAPETDIVYFRTDADVITFTRGGIAP
jgi:murein DD-endopeptidase MepM/ murein hydrolase activator NlpD